MCSFFFFVYPLRQLSAARMCMGVGLSTGIWLVSQGQWPWRKLNSSPWQASGTNSLSAKGWNNEPFPPLSALISCKACSLIQAVQGPWYVQHLFCCRHSLSLTLNVCQSPLLQWCPSLGCRGYGIAIPFGTEPFTVRFFEYWPIVDLYINCHLL